MKNKTLLLAVIIAILPLLFLTQSCDKVKDEVNKVAAFDVSMNLPDQYFVLDSNDFKSTKGILEEKVFSQFYISVNLDSIFEANGISTGLISDGEFTAITVSLENPAEGVNFDFVNSMRVTVSETSDFAEETLLASTGTIADGSTSVTFNLETVNILDYLNKKDFYMRLYGDQNGPLPANLLPMLLQSGIKFTVEPL